MSAELREFLAATLSQMSPAIKATILASNFVLYFAWRCERDHPFACATCAHARVIDVSKLITSFASAFADDSCEIVAGVAIKLMNVLFLVLPLASDSLPSLQR